MILQGRLQRRLGKLCELHKFYLREDVPEFHFNQPGPGVFHEASYNFIVSYASFNFFKGLWPTAYTVLP